jgi:hypothetical protein
MPTILHKRPTKLSDARCCMVHGSNGDCHVEDSSISEC